MSECGLDIRVNRSQGGARQCNIRTRNTKRTEVISTHGHIGITEHRVVRRILNHVESDVSKVPFVRDPIAAAETRLTVSEDVPCEPNSRGPIVLIGTPDAFFACRLKCTITDTLLKSRTFTEEEVGIESLFRPLRAVVFVTQAKIQGESGTD